MLKGDMKATILRAHDRREDLLADGIWVEVFDAHDDERFGQVR
jgi:hypothetical protein